MEEEMITISPTYSHCDHPDSFGEIEVLADISNSFPRCDKAMRDKKKVPVAVYPDRHT